MGKEVIEASEAVAKGAALCRPAVIPMYPITPQTHIVERLADYINDGILDSEMIHCESEHSAISANLGAQATGVRTFTATSSQGLALMHEILFVVSGMRLPVVMAVANRTLSAPINIWNDHQDAISARDSGWLQLYVESSQEALDTVIMAYKIAENKNILLPVMVCLDGFTLSHVYEPADIPSQKQVDSFLPSYKAIHAYLDPKKPITQGPIAFPDTFMELRKMQQDAMEASLPIIEKTNKEFKTAFGRSYGDGLIETYKIEDADSAIVGMGSMCGTTRVVVDTLRKKGKKIGLIKIKSFRPFPTEKMKKICKNLKGIAVIDRSLSPGNDAALFTEVKSALRDSKLDISGFIAGLGGRDITEKHLIKAVENIGNKKTNWLL